MKSIVHVLVLFDWLPTQVNVLLDVSKLHELLLVAVAFGFVVIPTARVA